jgi:hypothetical protein
MGVEKQWRCEEERWASARLPVADGPHLGLKHSPEYTLSASPFLHYSGVLSFDRKVSRLQNHQLQPQKHLRKRLKLPHQLKFIPMLLQK